MSNYLREISMEARSTTRQRCVDEPVRADGLTLLVMLGDIAQTTDGKWIDPPADAMPERPPPRPELSPRRTCRLPRPRRWRSHELASPNVRSRGVWPAAQHALHGAGRACGRAHLDIERLAAEYISARAPERADCYLICD
jgi:hypothetical protein